MKAALFPGQGSQTVGMGKSLYDAFESARQVFMEVDDTLGQHLTQLMFEGSLDELTLTSNAQPALMAVSMAALAVLKKDFDQEITLFQVAAGHSLGEYTALAATGSLSLRDTARLLRIRGDAMQKAVPPGQGGMMAVLGLTPDVCEEVAAQASQKESVCVLANDNAEGQVVLSGHVEALERASVLAKERGALKCISLSVSAPFHSPLMAPAAVEMEKALSDINFARPKIPVILNVTAESTQDASIFKETLVEQITGRVRWTETMRLMERSGIQETVEIGSGRVLSGLVRRTAPQMGTVTLGSPQEIEAFVNSKERE